MFSKGDFKDKSCGKDVFSEGDFKDKWCGGDVFSIGASKDKSKCPLRVDETVENNRCA